MNEKIMNWASDQVYQGQLIANDKIKGHSLEEDCPILTFIDTSFCYLNEATSES